MKENLLKKEFKYKDVQRARNLIKKDYHAKTVEGVGYQKVHEERKEGDIWQEDGKTWTIKNGIKQTISKLDSIRKSVAKPLHCPKCNGIMNHHFHAKMWKIHGMCYDCVIEMEAGLRKLGKFEQYERAMITGNLTNWAKDMEQFLSEALNETETYVTEAGDVEDWQSNKVERDRKIMATMEDFIKQVQDTQKKLDIKE